jgi:outer membrane lipoprotein SlyB
METQTHTSKPLHPLAWVAGVAIILFSAVGIAAFMGWTPTAMGGADNKSLLEAQSATAAEEATKAPLAVAAPARKKAHVQAADNTPARPNRCSACGVVESVREIETKGTGSGLGAVGGGVVGGLLGNQVGGGRGKDVATVVGVVGGAMAGNEVEKRSKSTKSYVITVRFDDGSSRVIDEINPPVWRAGDKVKVVNGSIQSNG